MNIFLQTHFHYKTVNLILIFLLNTHKQLVINHSNQKNTKFTLWKACKSHKLTMTSKCHSFLPKKLIIWSKFLQIYGRHNFRKYFFHVCSVNSHTGHSVKVQNILLIIIISMIGASLKYKMWDFTCGPLIYVNTHVTDMNYITHRRFFVHLYQLIHWYLPRILMF